MRNGSREAAAFEIRLAMRSPLFGDAVEMNGFIMTSVGWDIVATTVLYLHDPLTILMIGTAPQGSAWIGLSGLFQLGRLELAQ